MLSVNLCFYGGGKSLLQLRKYNQTCKTSITPLF